MMKQALKGSRRAIEGQRKLLAHYDHGQVDAFHAPQDIGHQIAAVETRRIPAIGYFVVCPAVDVVEDRPRQPALRQFTEIMEVMAIG